MNETSDHDELVRRLGEQLDQVATLHDQVEHAFARQHGLHPTDLRALLLIYRSYLSGMALTAGEFASHLDLSSGAVTYLVERLSASGLVERASDPKDRRKVILRHSDLGLSVAKSYLEPLADLNLGALRDVDSDQLRAALEICQALESTMRERERALRTTSEEVSE